MNHPTPEELAGFIYEELPEQDRADISRHLESCPDCRAQVDSGRGVHTALREWQVPEPRSIRPAAIRSAWAPIRWAAAAVLLIACGYGIARLTSPAVDVSRLRAQTAQAVRAELKQEFAAEMNRYAAAQASRQQEFERAMDRALRRIEANQVVDAAALRTDVETVALRTQEEFNRLASMERPAEEQANE